MSKSGIARRLGAVATGAVAIVVASASVASAHHCYKDEWAQAAYDHLKGSNTAWVTLSDLGTMFLLTPEQQEVCAFVVDDAVEAWMEDREMSQEPLIHSKATVGSGAFYKKGMAPKPFEYLGDSDFMALEMAVVEGLIANDCPMPPAED